MKVLDGRRESAIEEETLKATEYVCVLNLLKTINRQVWRREPRKWGELERGLGRSRLCDKCGWMMMRLTWGL